MSTSETPPKAIKPRPAPYLQSPAGARRDAAARENWDEIGEKGRMEIRHAVPRLYEIHGMGDTSVAELLFALGQAGILERLTPGVPATPEPVRMPALEAIVRYGLKDFSRNEKNGKVNE